MKFITISDPSLRDGNHAVKHQLNQKQIEAYCISAEKSRIPIVEVGHGNGLGASSLQIGLAAISDQEMLETARKNLNNTKLGIHVMPGIATIKKHLSLAIQIGVDVIRVASHCTEADITQRHIAFSRENGKETYGVLMMSHMTSKEVLLEESQKMESYGAEGIIIMDSAGAYLPIDVSERISLLVKNLNIPVGFHAHNNLGMSISNSIAAVESGALIIDGTSRGFGAGAGNAQLEVLIAVLHKMGYETGIDLYKVLDLADLTEKELLQEIPAINSMSIVSGLSGVFSGFSKHVSRIAEEFHVDARDIFFQLGKKKVVGGQEDLIVEVAAELANQGKIL